MDNKLKVIVAGGRDFNDKHFLFNIIDIILYRYRGRRDVEIITGGAKGADSLGKQYAIENGLLHKEFPAQWGIHGKSAGFLRNIEMAEYLCHQGKIDGVVIAFWDGKSKGTRHMIESAQRLQIPVNIIRYDEV